MTDDDHAFRVLRVDWGTHEDQIMAIRQPVFIEEQQVPEHEERDGLDHTCVLVLAMDAQDQPVGTARMLPDGQIGRMAVLKAYRNRGIGTALIRELLAVARERRLDSVFLHGQVHAIPFYQAHGFVAEGPEFEEAGIMHRIMRLKITPK